MRKQWLIPTIGTIGNFFSVTMMVFPILIAMLFEWYFSPDRVLHSLLSFCTWLSHICLFK